ncbi:MAG: hypothetical protein WAQ28_16555 [Bacteroidia bacterium]|jgi:predicted O-methyltransferase YrrM
MNLQLFNYWIYWFKSTNEHGVHSPFVFDLVTQVIYNNKDYYSYKSIEAIRERLLNSGVHLKPLKYGRLLFRLVNYFQPETILITGESAGIETAYMAAANSKTEITVVEPAKDVKVFINESLKSLQLKNVLFCEKLNIPDKRVDFVYLDGGFGKIALLEQFNMFLKAANDSSVFIISDIYCSSEIKEVWAEIKNHERVRVTVDLFYMGIVFFRKEQVKEHFVIRF